MTTKQALRLEEICERLNPSEGELLWLARICAADEALVSLGHLSRVDAEDMISTLQSYERWLLDHSQEMAEEMMLEDLTSRERKQSHAA